MDVKCERCSTEYEFDDALVSGRGTTVKCTNCGHKFKIHRTGGDYSEDYWNVTTGDGRTLVFTSLRELQRAISGYLVERNDRISRGGLPPKPIGHIPELLPFFEQRDAGRPRYEPGRSAKPHHGVRPGASVRPRQGTKPDFLSPPATLGVHVERPGKKTLIGTGPLTPEKADTIAAPPPVVSVPPPPTERAPDTERAPPPSAALRSDPPAAPEDAADAAEASDAAAVPSLEAARAEPSPAEEVAAPEREEEPASAAPSEERAHASGSDAPAPAPPAPPSEEPSGAIPQPEEPATAVAAAAPPPTPAEHPPSPRTAEEASWPDRRIGRSLLAEIEREHGRARSSEPSSEPLPRRRSVGGFIVAAVVMVCVSMLAAVWARDNLGVAFGTRPAPSASSVDPRVSSFLSAGEKALSDGDLELAKESYDKASALVDHDPQVRIGLARLAAVRADMLWLKQRLLPEDAVDEHRVTRDALADLAARARTSADEALAVAPEEPAAVRAKIDALRISGDRDGARALVAKMGVVSGPPESAYVLAMLDLAEPEPLWQAILDRLRTAANAETGPGRARAAFIYALARSGDHGQASAELERLRAMPRGHELLPLLRRVVDEARPSSGTERDPAEADAASPPPEGLDAGRPARAAQAPAAPSADPREFVKQADSARARGDYVRARALYSAALEKSPNDSEALAGLAAIAYAQRDLGGARAAYKRVLATNPNYMPALVGLADVEWDAGDKATAAKMYKDIVDRYPEGAYPARIKQRIEGGG